MGFAYSSDYTAPWSCSQMQEFLVPATSRLCGLRSYFECLRQGSRWHGRLGAFANYSSRGR
jgi:hypothetical protein